MERHGAKDKSGVTAIEHLYLWSLTAKALGSPRARSACRLQ